MTRQSNPQEDVEPEDVSDIQFSSNEIQAALDPQPSTLGIEGRRILPPHRSTSPRRYSWKRIDLDDLR